MRRTQRFAIVSLLSACSLCVPTNADGPSTRPSTSVLSSAATVLSRVPTVEFKAVAFTDVLDFIRDVAHLNLYVNWPALEAAGIDRSTPITLRLHQIPLHTVMDLVLRQANGGGTDLTWYISDNICYITTRELAGRQLITQTFDVRDLLVTVPEFTDAPNFDLGSGGGGGSGGSSPFSGSGGSGSTTPDESLTVRGDRLAELVKMLVQPDIWIENGGFSSIRYFNGCLIVTAPRDVLQKIFR